MLKNVPLLAFSSLAFVLFAVQAFALSDTPPEIDNFISNTLAGFPAIALSVIGLIILMFAMYRGPHFFKAAFLIIVALISVLALLITFN